MFRFTTPYHKYKVPFDPTQLTDVYITYAVAGVTILEFSINDEDAPVHIDEESRLVVHFTQEQSALFECGCNSKVNASVQLRGKFTDGEVWASKHISVVIEGVYKEEVI